ncbi:hypothetical protein D7Z26_26245 [Cohnella endophytica]|uniref:DUF5317 domain-containing protein n=1 Tax=Cohnella endophytica TaxID=2419778 RepID=A0A494X230_9BACL|nr:DUF5317 domain-containing protein [Cohnella endophytica]RKP44775.1 hypothetical protein D7Z26_26245 [Cohnella endophytica]
MVYDGIVIGLIVGWIRAGWRNGLAALSQIRIRGGWIFPVLLLIQLGLYSLHEKVQLIRDYNGYMFMVIYVAGLYMLWLNRKEKGFWWIFVGVGLNFLVMLLNGGKMPVSADAISVIDPTYAATLTDTAIASKHALLNDSTFLPFLADIIPLTLPYPRNLVISIGDVIMNFGIFIYLQQILLAHKHRSSFVETNSHKI